MSNRIGNLLTLGGIGLIALSNCLYLVDPGEKALIMNQLTGLQKKVYNQGYNFKVPFLEVIPTSFRAPSSTMPVSDPSTFTSPPVLRTSRLLLSRSGSCSNPSQISSPISISSWVETMRRKSSTPLVSRSSGPSLPSVSDILLRRRRSAPQIQRDNQS